MEPSLVAGWGVASGLLYAAVARRVDVPLAAPRRQRALDFYVIAWYALAATCFLAGGLALAVGAGASDFALLATLRLGLVLSFVMAAAALLAAGAHYIGQARRAPA